MKVLIATDGSELAENAASLLAHLPHSEKLEIVVLSVRVPAQISGSREVVEWLRKSQEEEMERADAACRKAAEMFEGANATVRWMTCEGHAGQTIVQQATEMQADLVVVGAKGHSLLGRVLLGSVSDFVATHADCSVLVVRPTQLSQHANKAIHVCVAHDESGSADFAVEQLGQFDWSGNSEIQVVSVLQFPYVYDHPPVEFDIAPIRQATEASLKEAAKSLTELSPNVTQQVIEANHVGHAIVNFAERNENDLIVLGSTGLGLLGKFLLGSVANYVLRHSECSVWIARERKPAPETSTPQTSATVLL